MKKRFTEEQIIGFLREAEAGLAVAELCRRHGFSEASYYLWRSKFGGMNVSDPVLLYRNQVFCESSPRKAKYMGLCLNRALRIFRMARGINPKLSKTVSRSEFCSREN